MAVGVLTVNPVGRAAVVRRAVGAMLAGLLAGAAWVTPARAGDDSLAPPTAQNGVGAVEEGSEGGVAEPDPTPTATPEPEPVPEPLSSPTGEPGFDEPVDAQESALSTPDSTEETAADQAVPGYFSVPFSPDLYLVTTESARVLTFSEWDAAGRPEPVPFSAAAYARVSWSPSVYAILDWHGDGILLTTRHLTFAEWDRAGRPKPTVLTEIPGSRYLCFRTSPETERFVQTPDGQHHRLSDEEWLSAGEPDMELADLGFYKAPWAPEIYAVSDDTRTHMTAADMAWYGNPTWAPAPVAYVRHSWSGALYGVVSWRADDVVAYHLSPGQWDAVGRPTAEVVGRVPGTTYFRWATSDQIFALSPDRAVHHLTPAEYVAAGSPAFDVRANQGLLRLTWDDTIWIMDDLALGQGRRITPEEYAGLDHPAPRLVARMIGDQFTRDWGTADVLYSVLGRTWRIAYWQWVAAGSPQPVTTYPPLFTYGTLRYGQPAYGTYLAGRTTSEVLDSIDGLSLYYSASRTFPYAVPGGSGVIGERMHLRTDLYGSTIAGTDAYERYDPALPPDNQAYVRELWISRAGVRSWIYVAGLRQAAYVRANLAWIPSGDWLRR